MVVFVAAGFSLRRTGETPVPPRKVGRKILDWSQLGMMDFIRGLLLCPLPKLGSRGLNPVPKARLAAGRHDSREK
jgi:hypothetical protein